MEVNFNKIYLSDAVKDENDAGDIGSSNTVNSDVEFKFSISPNLEDIRVLMNDFVSERNWNKFHTPRNLLLAMVGEVGELAELFQWRGEVKEGLPDWTKEEKEHLGQELSDVFIYLLRLSEKCHIDLPAAVIKKIAMNKEKYPASEVWGCNKKYTEYQLLDKK